MAIVVLAGALAVATAVPAHAVVPRATAVVGGHGDKRVALGVGSYPRVIRLQHGWHRGSIVAAVNTANGRGTAVPIFESTDEGTTFTQIGRINDPDDAAGECCGTLFELPRRIGGMRAGTLLWAASYGQDAGPRRRVAIDVWASGDGGRHWSFVSVVAQSHNTDGVWEPEFDVDAGGTLWLHFADETEAPRFAQVLNRVGSTDGIHWGTKQRTLAIPPDRVRPGMPSVRKLPDGQYYFGYEICNFGTRYCDPYFKISADGANFGDTDDPGTRVETANGNYFQHAPTTAVFPGGPTGTRLLMVGQLYTDATGRPRRSNGQVLLANDHFGVGDWYEVPAPVKVPNAYNDSCPNYSSSLLPVDNGRNVLELAADYDAGVCTVFFAKGPAY